MKKMLVASVAFMALSMGAAQAADDIVIIGANTDLVLAGQGTFGVDVEKIGGNYEVVNQALGVNVDVVSKQVVDDIGILAVNSAPVVALQINGPDTIGTVVGDLKKTNVAAGAVVSVNLK